jgi:prepilin-type N-terminal cleavage/methylation domain-containing protein
MQTTQRSNPAAFSLIEMLAVITIIVILVTIVIGALGFVSDKQARSKALVQTGLLAKAIEDYKLDFNIYPETDNSPTGEGNSHVLFEALYWDSDADGKGAPVGTSAGDEDQKIYLPELDPANNKQGWTSGTPSKKTKILDPWGKEYRYRSASKLGETNTNTQNPGFDLWSMGKDGKSKPESPKDKTNRDDIKCP